MQKTTNSRNGIIYQTDTNKNWSTSFAGLQALFTFNDFKWSCSMNWISFTCWFSCHRTKSSCQALLWYSLLPRLFPRMWYRSALSSAGPGLLRLRSLEFHQCQVCWFQYLSSATSPYCLLYRLHLECHQVEQSTKYIVKYAKKKTWNKNINNVNNFIFNEFCPCVNRVALPL